MKQTVKSRNWVYHSVVKPKKQEKDQPREQTQQYSAICELLS